MSSTIELAKRAVACKGWRWMPGMRDVAGLLCTVVDGNGSPTMWATSFGTAVTEEDIIAGDPAHPVPDLDDPATLGCLLTLVREAWGGDVHIYESHGPRGGSLVISRNAAVLFKADGGPGRADRLVAALESAPAHAENSDV